MNLATGFYCSTIYLFIFVYPLIARHDKKKISFFNSAVVDYGVYNISLYMSSAQENV